MLETLHQLKNSNDPHIWGFKMNDGIRKAVYTQVITPKTFSWNSFDLLPVVHLMVHQLQCLCSCQYQELQKDIQFIYLHLKDYSFQLTTILSVFLFLIEFKGLYGSLEILAPVGGRHLSLLGFYPETWQVCKLSIHLLTLEGLSTNISANKPANLCRCMVKS